MFKCPTGDFFFFNYSPCYVLLPYTFTKDFLMLLFLLVRPVKAYFFFTTDIVFSYILQFLFINWSTRLGRERFMMRFAFSDLTTLLFKFFQMCSSCCRVVSKFHIFIVVNIFVIHAKSC